MGRIVLVGGGARSGKSRFALERACRDLGPRAFLATATAGDEEMARRIERHREERASRAFETIEEPHHVPEAIRAAAGYGAIVLDCVTLWLSNLLVAGEDSRAILDQVDRLVAGIRESPAEVILVTNEVGMGLVPETPLGRAFRDVAGEAHQVLAAASDEIYFAVLGVVVRLRPGPIQLESGA